MQEPLLNQRGHKACQPAERPSADTDKADLNVGLVLDPVDVLVQSIQQKGQELLAVMLLVAAELRSKLSDFCFEAARHHSAHLRLQKHTIKFMWAVAIDSTSTAFDPAQVQPKAWPARY